MDKITIENMDLYYNDFQALKKVNLNIPANEITAFIGPSGCGKSTLLKSLNRMNDLVEGCRIEGNVLLDGQDVYKMDANLLRKRVGMVFQKPNPFAKRGRSGKVFYGCSNYPSCTKAFWYKPTNKVCPKCGELLLERNTKNIKYSCSNDKCGYKES